MKKIHYHFTTTNIGTIVTVFAFALCFIGSARASTVSLLASSDTYITDQANLGGPTSIHGLDDSLWLSRGSGVTRKIPLVRFDLTAYENRVVSSPTAELRLKLVNAWSGQIGLMQSVSIRETLVDWDEKTVSFANFGGTGFNEAAQSGPNLVTRNVMYTGLEESILFTIPSSVVQGWVDNSAKNYGFIVISNTPVNRTDFVFSSREGVVVPSLSFDVAPVPVPSAIILFSTGLLGVFGAKKYNDKRIKGGRTKSTN